MLLWLLHYLCGESLTPTSLGRESKAPNKKTHEHIALRRYAPKRGHIDTEPKVDVLLEKNPSTADFLILPEALLYWRVSKT